jgi:hypothetical protein
MAKPHTEDNQEPNPAFKVLTDLVERAKNHSENVERLEEELRLEEQRLLLIVGGFNEVGALPAKMRELGLSSFTTKDGLCIELERKLKASISEARKPEAFAWLEENGHAALIKREVSVSFNREQAEEAVLLLDQLRGKFPGVNMKQSVHASTLEAWVRQMRKDGEDIPCETFGIREFEVAKSDGIGRKRSKKNLTEHPF